MTNKNTSPRAGRRQLIATLSAVSLAVSSLSHPGYAQQNTQAPSAEQREKLMQLAAEARASADATESARAAAEEKTREQLGQLTLRLGAVNEQNAVLMQMMGQILASQAGASNDERLEIELRSIEQQVESATSASDDLGENVKTDLEDKLAEKTEQLKSVMESVPRTKEELKNWKEEQIKEVEAQIEKAKREMDEALDKYVEEEVLPAIVASCSNKTEYEQRALITTMRGPDAPTDVEKFLRDAKCNAGPDIVRTLTNTRNAEQTQEAVQSAMSSLMTTAMMTGNPYIIAIAAVLALISALFADGDGDGDGDGVDDQEGGGPIPGAPAPMATQNARTVADTTNPVEGNPENQSETDPIITNPVGGDPENAPEPVVDDASDPIDPRLDVDIDIAGGDPRVKSHEGVGCNYEALKEGDVLQLNAKEGVYRSVSISIKALKGTEEFDFPESWISESVRLVSCDFEASEFLVQVEDETSTTCLKIELSEDSENDADTYKLSDAGFSANPGELCKI